MRKLIRRTGGAVLLLGAAVALPGCKPDAAVRTGAVLDSGTKGLPQMPGAPAPTSPDAGSLTGTVTFRGTPPPRVAIDMSMDPACAFGENHSEQVVVNGGKLANVYVYLKGVPASSAPAGQAPVVLDQRGCQFTPHVIAVQQGGSVQFNNSDRTMHNVHMVTTVAGDPNVDVSQEPGSAPQVRPFAAAAVMLPVRCNNHPWMNAFINVADSPFFAVTGADGRFTLHGIPPGAYTLAVVQEKLGEQDVPVTVPARGTGNISVAFAAR